MIDEKIAHDGGKLVLEFAEEVLDKEFPRLAGSLGEKKCADNLYNQMQNNLGNAEIQEFEYAHASSYNTIPIIGGVGAISFICYYFSPIASLVLCVLALLFFFIQICFHKGWLDCLFPKKTSRNVISKVCPNGDKNKFTLLFAGNIDSFYQCHNSKISEKLNLTKMFFSIFSFVLLFCLSIMAICNGMITIDFLRKVAVAPTLTAVERYAIALYCLPILCLPGFFWIANYVNLDSKKAPASCINGLIGTELGVTISKYYMLNPTDCPKDCTIMNVGFGAETIGQKGSEAFCRQNKQLLDQNVYVINLGGFGESDIMDIKVFDLFSRSEFDESLIDLATQSMEELNLNYRFSQNIINCSPAMPFATRGVKTLAINPQVFFTTDKQLQANEISKVSHTVAGNYLIFLINLIPKIAAYNELLISQQSSQNKDE